MKNNYSSGRNDDRLNNPNGANVPQAFVPAEVEGGPHQADVLPVHPYSAVGNMNLNNMLIENVRSHDYFKGLSKLATFQEVVDQIYYDVQYVTPWRPGTHKTQRASGMCSGLRGVSNAGVPSTAYMLLMKLYTLQVTKSQIQSMLDHTDSPYIRAIGLLYLRQCCDPKQLWGWVEKYASDEEKFDEGGEGNEVTIGRFVRRLLTEQEFYDTMLPRLPVPIAREMQKKLDELPPLPPTADGGGGEGRQWESKREERAPPERETRPPPRDEPPSYRDLDNPVVLDRRGAYDERRDHRREERSRDEPRREERRDERSREEP